MVGFCDLLGTPYAPVSKIASVKAFYSAVFRTQLYDKEMARKKMVLLKKCFFTAITW